MDPLHNIREEFKSNFPTMSQVIKYPTTKTGWDFSEYFNDKFNEFLESYGNAIRAEIREKIEKCNGGENKIWSDEFQDGFNKAKHDVLASITPKEEN